MLIISGLWDQQLRIGWGSWTSRIQHPQNLPPSCMCSKIYLGLFFLHLVILSPWYSSCNKELQSMMCYDVFVCRFPYLLDVLLKTFRFCQLYSPRTYHGNVIILYIYDSVEILYLCERNSVSIVVGIARKGKVIQSTCGDI